MALSPNVPVVAPGELITSAHINNMRSNLDRLDTTKLALAGGTVTGALITTGGLRVEKTGSARPAVEFFKDDNTTRTGLVCGADTGLELTSFAGPVQVFPAPGSAETVRFDAANVLIGKQATNMGVIGVEIPVGVGGVRSTIGVASNNYYANHIASADVNGCAYAQFARVGTVVGSITQVSTTGVVYNTTSDRRLKTITRPVDPDESVGKVAAMDPVNYLWTQAPADGEQTGFVAQDLVAVAPEAVTVGTGEPGEPGFVPWMVDLSRLVPTLVAAVQSLTRRIEQLENTA